VFPIGTRQSFKLSVIAILTMVLYRYWLIAPVLRVLSKNEWQAVAFAVAAMIGAVFALWRLDVLGLACGSMAGLLLGGTWAFLQSPSDVPISLGTAFRTNLETFWQSVILLTATVTVSGFCSNRLAWPLRR
jgi:hypothetical protein